jgi:hypothetical protein
LADGGREFLLADVVVLVWVKESLIIDLVLSSLLMVKRMLRFNVVLIFLGLGRSFPELDFTLGEPNPSLYAGFKNLSTCYWIFVIS